MRRNDKEITDWQKIEDILKKGKLCHIAMADGNKPYLVTVSYGYRDNTVYFHSASEGKKIGWLRKNPRVCFMIYTDEALVTGENPCRDWSMKYKSVIGYGKVRFLNNPEEKAEGLNIIMAQYTKNGPFTFSEKNLEETAVIKIEIEEISAKGSGYE
jgi:nitroimidazol reductase NimA-like FMN-containing flavoprotein (pyridoxamine 5'-phosphate oxidase superfamily)